ncbi:hypothetical protein ACJJTC_018443, partial [Scirpophaga incertulas]
KSSSVAVKQLTTSLSFVNCQICKLKFHLHCVNIQKQLKDLSEDFKTKFACPGCRSKFPKLDNTNTPIRSGAQPIIDPEEPATSNVNCRRGNRKPVHQTESSVTTDDIRQIIKEELESVLNSFKVSILKEFEQRTKELVENFNQISEAIKVFEQQQENLSTDLKSNSERINVLEAENISLKDTVIDLQSRIDRIEQHSRASNLEIQNVPEHKSENIYAILQHYNSIEKIKPLLKNLILACWVLAETGKPVFVVEHLSPVQKALHAAARFKARELNYKFVWIRGGKIFMRKTESSEYKLIKNTQDLSNLI